MAAVPEETMLNWASLQDTMSGTKKRAMRALIAEYTSLLKEPAEGFVVKVEDPFNWDVGIYGPPSTPYWGGYFKVHVSFPDDYPFEPPKLKFKSRFWHPNVYHNGSVCMSILHDPHTEEIPTDLPREEKWNPTLSVRTVLLSLISILGSPNPDSPANPEASKMYRSWTEEGDQDYVKVIEDIVRKSKKTATRDGVTVPKTLEEYVSKPEPAPVEPLARPPSDSDGDDSVSEHSELLSSSSSDNEVFLDAHSWTPSASEHTDGVTYDDSVPSLLNRCRNDLEPPWRTPQPVEPHAAETSRREPRRKGDSDTSCPEDLERAFRKSVQTSSSQTRLSKDVEPSCSDTLGEHTLVCSPRIPWASCSPRVSEQATSSVAEETSEGSLQTDTSTDRLPASVNADRLPSAENCPTVSRRSGEESTSVLPQDESLTLTGAPVPTRPPNNNRKRRRPPRLCLYLHQNDSKKRKR